MDFSNLKVLVYGDICLDVTEEGESTRLSPEAPVPVISNPIINYSLGMAGNTALNLKNLGADVDLCSIWVNDNEGKIISSLLIENEIIEDYKKSGRQTNGKTISKRRIISNGNQVARVDNETPYDNNIIKECIIDSLTKKIDYGKYYDLIIISDYNKYMVDKSSWFIIKGLLLQLSDTFFVDTKKKDILNYYKGMCIFPNRKEMTDILNYNNLNNQQLLREAMESEFIIETASEEGAYLYEKGNLIYSPAVKKDYINISGAGDVFVVAFSLYYTKFKNKRRALEFANYCCSIAIMKKGTCNIELNEVIDFNILGVDKFGYY